MRVPLLRGGTYQNNTSLKNLTLQRLTTMQWFQIQEQMKSDVLFLDYVIFRIRKSDNSRVLSGAISKHQKAYNTLGTRLGILLILHVT